MELGVVAVLGLVLSAAVAGSRDIYRTYERVEHVYDYPEPKKEEKDPLKEYEDYWDSIIKGGGKSDEQDTEYKQEKQTGIVETNRDADNNNNNGNNNNNYDNGDNGQGSGTTTVKFYDPNVPMCYNCFYNNVDGKSQGSSPQCDDGLFSDAAILTIPCASGLCTVTHTIFEDGGEMVIRGCSEDCTDYNTSKITVQCCRGTKCNGPHIAEYNQRSSSASAIDYMPLVIYLIIAHSLHYYAAAS